MKKSKKFQKVQGKIDKLKIYSIEESIKLLKEVSYTKFVGSLDININLNIPTKFKKESIRGSVVLPHQTGQVKKVAVIASPQYQKEATDSGADEVGAEDLIKKIEEGYLGFDVLISTPDMMIKLAKLGKTLGPKGLMPNPKTNTVTTDVGKIVKSYKAGKLDYRMTERGEIKAKVGKLNQDDSQLQENTLEFLKSALNETRKFGPNRVKSVFLSPTMGPSSQIDVSQILKEI
jgi:large subunit ribosomal protein L1